MSNLKDWIKEQMTIDVASELAKHKETVKDFIQLTTSGDVILKKPNLTAKQKILIYLIGKVYSKVAEYSTDDTATNKDIMEKLGIKEGTLKGELHDLRGEGLINSLADGVHQIRFGNIASALEKYFTKGGEEQNE